VSEWLRNAAGLAKAGMQRAKTVGGGAPPYWEEDTKVYPPLEPDTAFAKAAEIVDRRDGYAMRLARTWQAGCLVAVVAAGVLGAGWYSQAQKASVERFFVPIDRMGDPGEVQIAGQLTPTTVMMAAAVEQFVTCAFALSSDQNVNAERYDCLKNMIDGPAKQRWNEWYRETRDAASERLVRIITIKQTANPAIWNVIWQEQDWKDGMARPWRRMNGDFTLEYRQPRNARDVFANKRGLFVVNMLFAPEQRTERN
jgi:type IV secretion system protein VirB5